MNLIKWFGESRKREGGQALVFTILVILILMTFLALIINVGETISKKIKMQNSADASALSGAIWQARALNIIATLNFGIMACEVGIAAMVINIGATCGASLITLAPLIKKLYTAIKQMAKVQDIVKKINPAIVEGEIHRIARLNSAKCAIAVAPQFPPFPTLHIHRLGTKLFNPGTDWEIDDETEYYNPSDSGINTIIPLPYLRDNDFDEKQYVFCIAVDEPAKIIAPGKRIFGAKNPVLFSLPEIKFAGLKFGGDIGYLTIAQARPVNPHEPHPLLLIPQWDVELAPVTAPGDIPIPGIREIVRILQEELICH